MWKLFVLLGLLFFLFGCSDDTRLISLPSSLDLNELNDVNSINPTEGQVVAWNVLTAKWVNTNVSGLVASGVSRIIAGFGIDTNSGVGDVNISVDRTDLDDFFLLLTDLNDFASINSNSIANTPWISRIGNIDESFNGEKTALNNFILDANKSLIFKKNSATAGFSDAFINYTTLDANGVSILGFDTNSSGQTTAAFDFTAVTSTGQFVPDTGFGVVSGASIHYGTQTISASGSILGHCISFYDSTDGSVVFRQRTGSSTCNSFIFNSIQSDTDFIIRGDALADNNLFFVDASLGSIGIGIGIPRASLDLRASTTSKNQLNLNGGTCDPTPNVGDICHDSTQLTEKFFATMGTLSEVDYVFGTSTTNSQTITNTVTETSFDKNFAFPANSWAGGKMIRFTAFGNYNSDLVTPSTLQLRFKSDTNTLCDTGAITMASNIRDNGWKFEGLIRWNGTGATARVMPTCLATIDNDLFAGNIVTATPLGGMVIGSTTAHTFHITAQFGGADTDNNTTLVNIIYEVLN